MIDVYRVGLIIGRAGLSPYQYSQLEGMLRFWCKNARRVVLMVPTFPYDDLDPDLALWFRARNKEECIRVDMRPVDRRGADGYVQEAREVLVFVERADELVGFPTPRCSKVRRSRVWLVYAAVPPGHPQWQSGMKIVQPWTNETGGKGGSANMIQTGRR